jgi:CysZ protein
MVLQSARLAASQMLEPGFRRVLWKSLGLTVLLLAGLWLGLEALVSGLLAPLLGGWPWVTTALAWMAGAGLFVGAIFLIAPVTALFAGLFLDDVAQAVEQRHYGGDRPGAAMAILPSLVLSLKFLLVVAGANLLALLLVLLPGVNFAVFFLVNGYLLGREYFQFAALRFRAEREANDLRRANRLAVFLAGLLIAGFMAVPLVNLATPVFAAALMVHLHKLLSRSHPLDSAPAAQRMAA